MKISRLDEFSALVQSKESFHRPQQRSSAFPPVRTLKVTDEWVKQSEQIVRTLSLLPLCLLGDTAYD